jgi:tryptophanyl-tRNA synthetase
MQDLLVSGVQPTNNLHIGNYIGALKQWLQLQHQHRCLFMVVDLHAITVPQDPQKLRANILDIVATYLALGLDPKRCSLFIQSEVPEHTELAWILMTIAKMGEMERMTQFKDKSAKQGESTSLGLFGYPVLMAADVLLYNASSVPVGEDQTQHVELMRDLAQRFNTRFGETFVLPKALLQSEGARIMALDEPTKKMSKSAESIYNYIALADEPDVIRKKIMKAVTDTDGVVKYDVENKPAISNLLTIFHHMIGEAIPTIEARYAGQGYGTFKKDLAEATVTHLTPIQERLANFRQDPGELMRILDEARDQARAIASETMKTVRARVGIGR